MAISPKLEVRQSQSLVMTPQLQQAIKLLQLSNIELASYVEQELERNPVLERQDDDGGPAEAAEPPGRAAEPRTDRGADSSAAEGDGARLADTEGGDGPLDTDYANDYTNDSAAELPAASGGETDGFGLFGWGGGGGGREDADFSLEQVLGGALTLKDHLRQQLQLSLSDPQQRLIGDALLEAVNEAGYLADSPAAVAERLGCEDTDVLAVLTRLQQFEPTGVFARDLKECLALQLRERDRYDPAMQALVEHLELLGAMDLPALMRVCRVDEEDIREMIAELKELDPKPGLAYDHEVASPVIPDVFVRQKPAGGWLVELNTDTLPRLLVNRQYYASVSRKMASREEKAYLSDCLQSANWLMKSLDQRARTILKVASELVRQQDGFLRFGVSHLRPLNLRTIAENVQIHESTVSRVTANKYMATPRGIFELKYFFTSAISSATGGEELSSEAVRQKIRELIDAERPDRILSDDKLVELLHAAGIDIARRTVAKYREAMNIPSSVQRRRLKRMRA